MRTPSSALPAWPNGFFEGGGSSDFFADPLRAGALAFLADANFTTLRAVFFDAALVLTVDLALDFF